MSESIRERDNFYPRPPRGGRRSHYAQIESGDKFLSTPSARRATSPCVAWEQGHSISIHALREEGDTAATWHRRPPSNFYPRPPRGGRQIGSRSLTRADLFLSTPSARRATCAITRAFWSARKFLSTPSARRATKYLQYDNSASQFLSTPSARRATNGAPSPT